MVPSRTIQVRNVNFNSIRETHGYSPAHKMEAIANGVRARLEETTGFSRKLTDETVKTARALGIENQVIEKWSAQRLNQLAQETARIREIGLILNRA